MIKPKAIKVLQNNDSIKMAVFSLLFRLIRSNRKKTDSITRKRSVVTDLKNRKNAIKDTVARTISPEKAYFILCEIL